MWPARLRALGAAVLPTVAAAHAPGEALPSFASGFLHPLTGMDHFLAMLAVGIWGALLGGRAVWLLPVAFPLVMTVGAVTGISGARISGAEPAVLASVVILGGAIALNVRARLWVALAVVGPFALSHGYAHRIELPGTDAAAEYCAGFILATGLIHLGGVALGFIAALRHGLPVLRAVGAGIAGAGVALAAQRILA
ncbi:MAG: HupE/UreJ family protein [Proteobacteria bacterium]|nr:HupE/UreJ family protein [Pseudomonadota bacterium]